MNYFAKTIPNSYLFLILCLKINNIKVPNKINKMSFLRCWEKKRLIKKSLGFHWTAVSESEISRAKS